jgi:hypothetical protein
MKTVITLTGKARSGKDTFANMLLEQLPKSMKLNYADYLKLLANKLYGYTEEEKAKYRTQLQTLGTEIVRANNPDFWCDVVLSTFDVLGDNVNYLIVADARFPNEIFLDKWKDKFAIINLFVEREQENGLTIEQKNHPSELEMDKIPRGKFITIPNNGDLDQLQARAKYLSTSIIMTKKYSLPY